APCRDRSPPRVKRDPNAPRESSPNRATALSSPPTEPPRDEQRGQGGRWIRRGRRAAAAAGVLARRAAASLAAAARALRAAGPLAAAGPVAGAAARAARARTRRRRRRRGVVRPVRGPARVVLERADVLRREAEAELLLHRLVLEVLLVGRVRDAARRGADAG